MTRPYDGKRKILSDSGAKKFLRGRRSWTAAA